MQDTSPSPVRTLRWCSLQDLVWPETLAILLPADSLQPSDIAPSALHKSKTPGPLVPPCWVRPLRGPNPTIRPAGEPALFHIINVVHLIGYLGNNPEHKSVKASDRKYAVLSLATQRSWKGADEEWHSKTEWHRVVAWNGLGEYAATKLRKSDHIYVEGTLVSSTY